MGFQLCCIFPASCNFLRAYFRAATMQMQKPVEIQKRIYRNKIKSFPLNQIEVQSSEMAISTNQLMETLDSFALRFSLDTYVLFWFYYEW